MPEVRDLDVLRPPQRIVRLAGEEIDVSFIPTGLTFDIDQVTTEMAGLDTKKLAAGDPETARLAFDLSVKLCATFCQWKHPHMDADWFRENTDANQLRVLGEEIRAALTRAYEGIDPKNSKATEATHTR